MGDFFANQPKKRISTKASVHPHYPLGGGGAGRDTEIIKLCLHPHNTYYTAPPPQYMLHCTTTINNTAQHSASWIWTHIVYWHRTGADQQNHRRGWGQQRVSRWASLSLSNKSTTPWYLILRCIYASCFNEWGCLAGVPAAARCVVPHCQSFKPASRVLLCVNIYGR